MLEDNANSTRIFLYAQKPDEKCQHVTQRDGISPAKAEARIEKIEQERADFHKYYTEKPGEEQSIMTCVLIQGCLDRPNGGLDFGLSKASEMKTKIT